MDPPLSMSRASQKGIPLPYCKQLLTDLYNAYRLYSACMPACAFIVPVYFSEWEEERELMTRGT